MEVIFLSHNAAWCGALSGNVFAEILQDSRYRVCQLRAASSRWLCESGLLDHQKDFSDFKQISELFILYE